MYQNLIIKLIFFSLWAWTISSSVFEALNRLQNEFFESLDEIEANGGYYLNEIGIYFTEPLLLEPPENAEIISVPPFQAKSSNPFSIYKPEFMPLDSIINYLVRKKIFAPEYVQNGYIGRLELLMKYRNIQLSSRDLIIIDSLKLHMNHFNPSILDGSEDPCIILSFGLSCFRLFKAAYPGLFRVRLSREEIVILSYLAIGWYAHDHTESTAVALLTIYHPNDIPNFSKFETNLYELLDLNMKIAFKAVLSGFSRNVKKNNLMLLSGLKLEHNAENLLHSHRDAFDQIIQVIPNVNSVPVDRGGHIILKMIQVGHFNESALLKPELMHADGHSRENVRYVDFYSSAVYYAVKYANLTALEFLLNLDYDVFYGVKESIIPGPISRDLFNRLRNLFLSETAEEIIFGDPNIKDLKFAGFKIHDIIEKFENSSEPIRNLIPIL